MANTQVNPTRMELTRLKKKLSTAMRGHKLLKDKRDELMRQFLDMVRQNKALREKVEAGIHAANKNFLLARAATDAQVLDVALMAPKQEVFLEASERNVMSVEIPVFEYKTRTADSNDIYSYGFAFTSADLDDAVLSLSEVLPDMLKLAEIEKSCQLMAAEIEKTRRRVNALEHVMIPDLQTNIKYITMKLDENERANTIRLMKVKELLLRDAIEERREADAKAVEAFAKTIDITDSNVVLQYGAAAQKNVSEFSENTLQQIRTKDLGEIGDTLSDLVRQLQDFDPGEEKKGLSGFFRRKKNQLATLKAGYAKASANASSSESG